MIKTFLVTLVLMAIVLIFMGIRVLIIKGSKMSKTSVGGNKDMKRKKVYCIKTEDKLQRIQYRKKLERDRAKDNCSMECGSCGCM
jgi:hypothetical protein